MEALYCFRYPQGKAWLAGELSRASAVPWKAPFTSDSLPLDFCERARSSSRGLSNHQAFVWRAAPPMESIFQSPNGRTFSENRQTR
jgi:hypothetical protein